MRKTIINKVSCFFILFISICGASPSGGEADCNAGLLSELTRFFFAVSALYVGIDLLLGRRHVVLYTFGWIVYLMYGTVCTINMGGVVIARLTDKQFETAALATLIYILIFAALINCLFGLNREGWLSSKKTKKGSPRKGETGSRENRKDREKGSEKGSE